MSEILKMDADSNLKMGVSFCSIVEMQKNLKIDKYFKIISLLKKILIIF